MFTFSESHCSVLLLCYVHLFGLRLSPLLPVRKFTFFFSFLFVYEIVFLIKRYCFSLWNFNTSLIERKRNNELSQVFSKFIPQERQYIQKYLLRENVYFVLKYIKSQHIDSSLVSFKKTEGKKSQNSFVRHNFITENVVGLLFKGKNVQVKKKSEQRRKREGERETFCEVDEKNWRKIWKNMKFYLFFPAIELTASKWPNLTKSTVETKVCGLNTHIRKSVTRNELASLFQ